MSFSWDFRGRFRGFSMDFRGIFQEMKCMNNMNKAMIHINGSLRARHRSSMNPILHELDSKLGEFPGT